jgi:hypothetical protein
MFGFRWERRMVARIPPVLSSDFVVSIMSIVITIPAYLNFSALSENLQAVSNISNLNG